MKITKCYKIITKSNKVIAFTTNESDVIYNDTKYISFSTLDIKNIKENVIKIGNLISYNLIKESDIFDGVYNDANVEIFILRNNEKIIIVNGFISSIEVIDGIFVANIDNLKEKMNNIFTNELYIPTCRAEFCDMRCKLDVNKYVSKKCDKTFKMCHEIYNNAVNFRGEPLISNIIPSIWEVGG